MTDLYEHMMRDLENDLVAYIMGLSHMRRIMKMTQNKKGK